MLLFKKKDLLVVISKSNDTVQFTKPLKDILKYQHRYNYKFKMYENGKVTVADDYIIDGETLVVLFGSASVTYTSEGASYMEGSGGDGGEGESGGGVVSLYYDATSLTFNDSDSSPVFRNIYDNSVYAIENVQSFIENILKGNIRIYILSGAGYTETKISYYNRNTGGLSLKAGSTDSSFHSTVQLNANSAGLVYQYGG